MIERYRDGVVPEADVDAGLGADFEGIGAEVCELLDPRRADAGAGGDLGARPGA